VCPFENSNSKKEGVSRTYKGHDGYVPIFAYLGLEGYCVNTELRPGKQHCQKGTPEFLKQSIVYARNLTSLPLLIRTGSAAIAQPRQPEGACLQLSVDFIIKHNLHKETPEDWLAIAKEEGTATRE